MMMDAVAEAANLVLVPFHESAVRTPFASAESLSLQCPLSRAQLG